MNKEEVIKTRRVPFVFSDESRDAHRTVLPVDGWVLDRFNKNGIAFFNHHSYGNNPDMAIGTARAWIEGKKLVGYIEFEKEDINPVAEKVFKKVLSGTYKSVSVGFMPLERGHFGEGKEAMGESDETYYYGRRELLEISVTPLPSNANALVRSFGNDPLLEKIERSSVECDFVRFECDGSFTENDLECMYDELRMIDALAGAVMIKSIC